MPREPFPFRAFLLSLEAEGIPVRLQDYRRLALALQGQGPWTLRRLRHTLVALLAKNQSQAALIARRFDGFFCFVSAIGYTAQATAVEDFLNDLRSLATAPDTPLVANSAKQSPITPNNPASQKITTPSSFPPLRRMLLVLLAAVIGFAAWHFPPLQTSPKDNNTRSSIQSSPAPVGRKNPSPKPAPAQKEKPKTRLYHNVPYVQDIRLLRPESVWKNYAWATGKISLLVIAYLIYLYFNRKIRFPNAPTCNQDKPQRFSLAGLGGKPAPLLDRDTLDEAADAIGYFQSTQAARDLDVPSTIKATLARGGVPDLRFHRSKRIRSLLILRDQRAQATWNTAAEELAEGLQQRGLAVVLADFKGSPERFRLAGGGLQYLEDWEDKRNALILLIFSDARRLLHGKAWSELKQWPQCAWLDYREARLWPPDHPARRYGMPLYAADAQGIRAALKRFLSEQTAVLPQATMAAAPIMGEINAAALSLWLGDVLSWAQDCAVLQPVSFGLADALRRRFYPQLPIARWERLQALPGTQTAEGLLLHPLARRLLKQGFVKQRSPGQQSEVLGFLREQLDLVRPTADDSLAWLDWQSRRALLSLEMGEEAPELAVLAQTPLKVALSARLQEYGIHGEVDKMPLARTPHAATLQTLAWLPDNPLRQKRRDFYALSKGQQLIAGFAITYFFLIAILTAVETSRSAQPQQLTNWSVQGVDALAWLREQPKTMAQKSPPVEFRGAIFSLVKEIRLKSDIGYSLILYGGGYWQQQTLQVAAGQQAQLIVAQKVAKRPCVEALKEGLQAIVCLQDGSAPPQNWRDKLESMVIPDKPQQRQLSVGVELSITPDTQLHDLLLQTSAVDVIYRLTSTDEALLRLNAQALLDTLPLAATQVLWWGGDSGIQQSFRATLANTPQLARSIHIGQMQAGDFSRFQELLQPSVQPYIGETELLTRLKLNAEAARGSGDPIVLFRQTGDLAHRIDQPKENVAPDYAKWKVLWQIKAHYREIGRPNSVGFALNGRSVLSGSHDGMLKLWDVLSGSEIRTIWGYSTAVNSIAFSPGGRTVLSGGNDKTLRLWDVSSGKEIGNFTQHTNYTKSVAFSPNGRSVLSADDRGALRLLDVSSGKEIRKFRGHFSDISSVAFAPDGRSVLSGEGWDKTLKLWDVGSGKEIRTFSGHSGDVNAVAFAPDGNSVLSGSSDKTLKLWGVGSGKEIRTFSGHLYSVLSVAFAPDGRSVLSGSADETLKLWDVSSGKEIRSFSGHSSDVNSVAFSPDGRRAISGDSNGTLILWGAE